MFDSITIPFESVMLYNVAKLKDGIDFEEVELAIAEMCSHVKETYPDFIAGQVSSMRDLFLRKVQLAHMELKATILQ